MKGTRVKLGVVPSCCSKFGSGVLDVHLLSPFYEQVEMCVHACLVDGRFEMTSSNGGFPDFDRYHCIDAVYQAVRGFFGGRLGGTPVCP